MGKGKKARKELAEAKAKEKRSRLMMYCSLVCIVVAIIVIISFFSSYGTVRYSDGLATLTLRPNGRFMAKLNHGTVNGTYVQNTFGISFTVDDTTVSGYFDGDTLFLPGEWDDGHGHNMILFKQ